MRTIVKFVALSLMALVVMGFIGAVQLSSTPRHSAACHGKSQDAPSPKSNTHQCCTAGHNQALAREAITVQNPTANSRSSVDQSRPLVGSDSIHVHATILLCWPEAVDQTPIRD